MNIATSMPSPILIHEIEISIVLSRVCFIHQIGRCNYLATEIGRTVMPTCMDFQCALCAANTRYVEVICELVLNTYSLRNIDTFLRDLNISIVLSLHTITPEFLSSKLRRNRVKDDFNKFHMLNVSLFFINSFNNNAK